MAGESMRGGTWPGQSGEDGDRADRLFRGCLTAPRYNDSQGWLDKLSVIQMMLNKHAFCSSVFLLPPDS